MKCLPNYQHFLEMLKDFFEKTSKSVTVDIVYEKIILIVLNLQIWSKPWQLAVLSFKFLPDINTQMINFGSQYLELHNLFSHIAQLSCQKGRIIKAGEVTCEFFKQHTRYTKLYQHCFPTRKCKFTKILYIEDSNIHENVLTKQPQILYPRALLTLTSLITVEVGINVEGRQKLPNH